MQWTQKILERIQNVCPSRQLNSFNVVLVIVNVEAQGTLCLRKMPPVMPVIVNPSTKSWKHSSWSDMVTEHNLLIPILKESVSKCEQIGVGVDGSYDEKSAQWLTWCWMWHLLMDWRMIDDRWVKMWQSYWNDMVTESMLSQILYRATASKMADS